MENARNNKIIKKKYLQFFVSVLISILILQVTTIIDTMIVGLTLGTKEMSGVKAGGPIINMVAVLTTLISVGISMVISISLGRRDEKRASLAFTYGFILCLGVGALVSLFGVFGSDALVGVITSNQDIIEITKEYTKIVLISGPLFILASYLGYAIRCDGYAKLSMVLLVLGGLTNVAFDLIFILGFKMGVKGAAFATDMSFLASCLVAIVYLFKKNRTLRFKNIFKEGKEIKDITRLMFKNGTASSLRILFFNISVLVSNYVIGLYTDYMGIAIFSVCSTIALISSAVFQASGASMMPIMGVLFGERDFKGISLLVAYVLKFLVIVVLGLCILVVSLANLLYPMFGINNPTSEFTLILRLYSIGFIFVALNYIILYYFTALQKTVLSIVITLLEYVILSIPLTILLVPNVGINAIYITYIVSEAATLLITFIILLVIKKKKGYHNIFLLPKENNNILMDFTVLADNMNASLVSEDVGRILKENGIDEIKTNRVAVILEEMIVNTMNVKKKIKKSYIDVRIIKANNIIVSLRSNGYPYNPLVTDDEDISQKIISSFAINIKFNQLIGFNQTLMEV